MVKNLFITGPPATGKTALLRNLLKTIDMPIRGFAMQRLVEGEETRAFRLLDLAREAWEQKHPYSGHAEDIAINLRDDGRWQGAAHIFDIKGAAALQPSGKDSNSLVVMDELGVCEKSARHFQQAVLATLDGPHWVVGVIKPKDTPFLNAVRNHPRTAIVPICPRWQAEQILTNFLAQTQKQP